MLREIRGANTISENESSLVTAPVAGAEATFCKAERQGPLADLWVVANNFRCYWLLLVLCRPHRSDSSVLGEFPSNHR